MSTDVPIETASTVDNSQPPAEAARRCLACGYNLYGLGDEPRCPECGLRNIPEGYRRQVWELVDSGRWFFSGMFRPFQKRLPGWWWSLDREGDLRRSFHVAGRNVLIAFIVIVPGAVIGDAIRPQATTRYSYPDPSNPTGPWLTAGDSVWTTGLLGIGWEYSDTVNWDILRTPSGWSASRSVRPIWKPSFGSLWVAAAFLWWAIWTWVGPALVGLLTQIRKGLPDFARAPQTIMAAANYESHRLVYLSAVMGLGMATEVALRLGLVSASVGGYHGAWTGLCALVVTFAALGWVGPLRSDYTRQLIRSRFHAARVVVMYAFFLPFAALIIAAFPLGYLLGW